MTVATTSATAVRTFAIDKAHSEVAFRVRHLLTKIQGRFTDFAGTIQFDPARPDRSSLQFTINAVSIDTDTTDRDQHLRSDDFFDVERYPIITFKSTRVERVSDQEFQVTGDFTIHGVTRSVTFDGEYSGQSNIMGRQRAGLSARTKINRKDFDLTFGTLVEATQGALGEMVTIELDLEVAPQTAAEPATTASAS